MTMEKTPRESMIAWIMRIVHGNRPAWLQDIARADLERMPNHELYSLYACWWAEVKKHGR